MTRLATLEREEFLGILRIDNPPVNVLSPETIVEIDAAFAGFEADDTLRALVIECAGRSFVAGGDIATFDSPDFSAQPFNSLLARIESCNRPIVAALFGNVLGAGLELALACHLRVADPATKLGFPEINLGILPGSLGTQRLPRLAGLAAAWRMISSGRSITADEARRIGIVDLIADHLRAAARNAATRAAQEGRELRRTGSLAVPDATTAAEILGNARHDAEKRSFLPALTELIRCLEASVQQPFAKGEAVEAAAFERLRLSPQSRAQRHLFFAERIASRIPELPADVTARPVEKVGILGVGTMGAGIATAFANAGLSVTLVEASPSSLERGMGLIEANYDTSVKKSRMSKGAADTARQRIGGSTEVSALADVDLVIEAVFEDMDLKLKVAEQIGHICKPGAILATNTSTLDVNRIARATGRLGDVVGTHFFSPAHVMRLLEIVRGSETLPEVLQTVIGLARRIGKTAVVSGVCYGFIGNRMAEVYGRESEAMQVEGATPSQIDSVAESPDWIGMAMGPSRMLDMAGVDVGARTVIEWIKSGDGPSDPAYRAMCRGLFALGRCGQKTGQGYYRYEGSRAVDSADTAALAAELAAKHGVQRRAAIPEREIFERLLFPMVNEAAKILDEHIAYRPSDIDVVWTSGYGFPRWRGGPVFMADEIGISEIVSRLDHYAAVRGNEFGYWSVSPLLRRLADAGERLSDWRPQRP